MPRFSHVMLDLETLSTRTNAAVIQIAAVAFDIETGELGPRFNAYINESALVGAKVGHIDISTVAWWMQQAPAAALGAKLASEDDSRTLGKALLDFEAWFLALAGTDATVGDDAVNEIRLWAKGLKDMCWLEAAYERTDLGEVPWYYRAPRDMRTLFAVAPGGQPDLPRDEARKHDAVYDCEYQIAQVCAAWAALRQQRERAEGAAAAVPASPYPFANQDALNAYAEYQRAPDAAPAPEKPLRDQGYCDLPGRGY